MKEYALSLLFFSIFLTSSTYALSLDDELRLIAEVYDLKPGTCRVYGELFNEKLKDVGEIVFNTPVLSGDNDIACATCHIDEKQLTDGLPMSVGVGGEGEGDTRMHSNGVIVARNAFTLFGRASDQYKTFFWDGKVQEVDGIIYSPIGEGYSLGFASPLAVAAVLPILARDEFLGRQSFQQTNTHLEKINEAYFGEKLNAANEVLRSLILNRQDENAKRLIQALRNAGIDTPDLSVIGNALASFIASKVGHCAPSPWESYLSGHKGAISDKQKRGAIVFYGKGRCAGCHAGNLFTDFKFHSIGVPQGEFGTHIHRQDIGRAGVTHRVEDRYLFRTPPLILVSKTAPYGHNGSFDTLEEIVRFHVNPIPFFADKGWTSERELLSYGKILATRSGLLGFIDVTSYSELQDLLAFLKAL